MRLDSLLSDLRFARRTAFKHPRFTLTAVLTLALGIGITTAIFTVVNAVLVRALPYPEADRLVLLWGNVQRTVVERRGASFPDYADWRAQNRSFEGLAGHSGATFTLKGGPEPERIPAEIVVPSYFPLLRIEAALGRVLRDADDRPGAERVVVLSDRLWADRFGRRADIIGQPLPLDAQPYTVVGVLPKGFRGLTDSADLWVPAGAVVSAGFLRDRGSRSFPVLGRLRPSISLQQAQAEMNQISRALEQQYPDTNEKRGVEVARLDAELFGDLRPALLVAFAAVTVMLLIACANVANLFLARAEERQREMALRVALGASTARIYRQLVTESVAYTAVAGGLGVLLARWMTDALLAASPVTFPSFVTVDIDRTVLLFVLGLSAVVGVGVGIAPAWRLTRPALAQTIKESGARGTVGPGPARVRQGLVIAEIALAVILLAGAGLMLRTLVALTNVDPGFRPDDLLTMSVDVPAPVIPAAAQGAAGVAAPQLAPTAADAQAIGAPSLAILESLRGVSGLTEVALGSDIPLAGESSAIFYTPEGHVQADAQSRPRAYRHRVTPTYFRALGIPLVKGRLFTESEMFASAPVVIVSEEVARRFWRGQDPVGRRLKQGGPASEAPWLEVIGVVGEARLRALPRNPTTDPDLYFPFAPRANGFAVMARTTLPPDRAAADVRRAIRVAAPAATIFNVAPMSDRVDRQLAAPRFLGWLTSTFGALALLLAAIGVYGVMAQSIAQRTPEIGVRMALGASRGVILRDVLARGFQSVAVGLLLGGAFALGLMRVLEGLLFGVTPNDPLTYVAVAALLGLVALVALWIPARRATLVDPLVALRHE